MPYGNAMPYILPYIYYISRMKGELPTTTANTTVKWHRSYGSSYAFKKNDGNIKFKNIVWVGWRI